MKVDEKMIEAGAHVLRMATPAILRNATRTLAAQVIEAALSAAPTDYGELVQGLRTHAFDDCGGRELPTHIANIAADAIELLSALSVDGVDPLSRA